MSPESLEGFQAVPRKTLTSVADAPFDSGVDPVYLVGWGSLGGNMLRGGGVTVENSGWLVVVGNSGWLMVVVRGRADGGGLR